MSERERGREGERERERERSIILRSQIDNTCSTLSSQSSNVHQYLLKEKKMLYMINHLFHG
jgi:hypothetical protein